MDITKFNQKYLISLVLGATSKLSGGTKFFLCLPPRDVDPRRGDE
jgi:hypothetical protein